MRTTLAATITALACMLLAGIFWNLSPTPARAGNAETGLSQYAVKFVCGPNSVDVPVERGTYGTVINTHNPHAKGMPFLWKVAFATGQTDGLITGFTENRIGADAAQRFDCGARSVRPFSCPANLVQTGLRLHLGDAINWTVNDAQAQPVTPVLPGSWAARRWVSSTVYGKSDTVTPKYYLYRLQFCSCADSGGRISGGATARTDNGASGVMGAPRPPLQTIFTTSSGPAPPAAPTGLGNYNSSSPPANVTGSFTGLGDGEIVVRVFDDGNSDTGMSLEGDLIIDVGFPGKCSY